MASPVYQGVDRYGPTAYVYPGGGWPSSQTLSAPSFGASTCLVAFVSEFGNLAANPNIDHWKVPASWVFRGQGGATLGTGFSTNLYQRIHLYQCKPGEVAGANVRPEKADNTLFVPTIGADRTYWRVFVLGFTPSKLGNYTRSAGAGEGSSQLPAPPVPVPYLIGVGEGTFVQFTFGSFAFGGNPGTIVNANGWTERFIEPNMKIATKAFAASTTTQPIIYTKGFTINQIGSSFGVSLDTPPPVGGFGVYRDDRVHAT